MRAMKGMLWVMLLGAGLLGCGTNIGNGMVQVELAESGDTGTAGTMQAHYAGNIGEGAGALEEGGESPAMPEYDEVNVTLGAVQAHALDQEGDERWITLVEDGGTHDLLKLRNDITAVLGEQAIPAGEYTELRMIVSEGNVVVDGTTYPLIIPSAAQTGIKFPHRFQVEEDSNYAMVIDFDVAQSIEALGPTGDYLLEPVLSVRAFREQ